MAPIYTLINPKQQQKYKREHLEEHLPQFVIDLFEIVPASREYRIDPITLRPLQIVPSHPVILFGMREDSFNRRSSFELFMFLSVGGSFNQYGGITAIPVSFVALVRKEPIDCFACECFGSFVCLVKRLYQGMPVIGIAFVCFGVKNEALFGGGDESGLVAKFITLMCLAFGDTGSLWLVKAVEFVFGVALLIEESLALLEQYSGVQIQIDLSLLGFTEYLSVNSSESALELLKGGGFSFELLGVVVTGVFDQELLAFSDVALSEFDIQSLCQFL